MSAFSDDERLREWLGHIVENADGIAAYLNGLDLQQFAADRKTRDAVERSIERISEAAVRIGRERLEKIAPGVPLNEVRGLGNILRHHYDRVDPKLIWDTATTDVPALRAACAKAVREEGE